MEEKIAKARKAAASEKAAAQEPSPKRAKSEICETVEPPQQAAEEEDFYGEPEPPVHEGQGWQESSPSVEPVVLPTHPDRDHIPHKVYTAKENDTALTVAALCGVDVHKLIEINKTLPGLNALTQNAKLRAGTELLLPHSLPWRIRGHPWVGRSCFRQPDIQDGVWHKCEVTMWAPAGPEADEMALWHIKYDDDDSEDLEDWEVEQKLHDALPHGASQWAATTREAAGEPSKKVAIPAAGEQATLTSETLMTDPLAVLFSW